jgi:hypothetical protein
MRMKVRWPIVLAVVFILLSLPACLFGGDKSQRPSPQRKREERSEKREKPPLPDEFAAIEDSALRLYNLEGSGWVQARSMTNSIKSKWSSLQPKLRKNQVPMDKGKVVELHLAGLEASVSNRDTFKTKEHSNEIIGALQLLAEKFMKKVPSEIVKMEVSLREVALHATVGNWTIAQDLMKEAPKDWEELKPKAEEVGAREVGKNAEASFKELEEAIKQKDPKKVEQIISMLQSDMKDLRRAFRES